MPRKPRSEYPGAMYHVMSRGDRRENIFLHDVDRAWSSLGYLAAPEHRPACIRVDRLLGEHGIQADTVAAARRQFEQRMEKRRLEESDPEIRKQMQRGWCLGGDAFKREMLARIEGNLGAHHSGELHRASAEAKAERIVAEELQRLGWTQADLAARRKNDLAKLEGAARLRRETTLPLKAIAARVHWERPRQPMPGFTPICAEGRIGRRISQH